MMVLPKRLHTAQLGPFPQAASNTSRHAKFQSRQQVAGARAAVLEPFATELGLGADAGSPEASALQSSGFSVDRAVDEQVSVLALTSLPSYAVVYMHTHSGVTQSGAGVVATGELAGGDPAVQPLLADGSVMVVGVAGSSAQYYGITSRFVSRHLTAFRSNSLIFINGCALLQTTDFWSALSAQGAGVLVSWDNDSTNSDNYLTGAAFFNVMQNGSSVSSAMQTLKANGYGVSHYNGQTATLGFVGNGSLTLAAAAAGSAPPTPRPTATATATAVPSPTPTATSIPTDTPSPTATDVPTATATATAIPLTITGLQIVVKPGNEQSFDVHSAAMAPVQIRVDFPNGTVLLQSATSNSQGLTHVAFKQPASKITRQSRMAAVTVSGAGLTPATANYKIGFGLIDVSVQPSSVARGKSFTVWVHAAARSAVRVELRPLRSGSDTATTHTGPQGWAHVHCRLEKTRKPGASLLVLATLTGARKNASTSTRLTVS
jgi:hypothetical protein